jgi:CheY-like chemotaxis protein
MFGGKSAFVVSADPESRLMHAESLRFLGMETTVCAGIKKALENPVDPDVLILDIDDLSVDPKQAAFALSDGSAEDFLLVLSGSMNPTTLSGFAPAGVQCVCRSLPYGITGIASALLQDDERSGGPAERQISAGGLAGGRILLVDDNHVNRQVGRELLENSGLSVDVASNGREAVEAFSSESYDLVLMDLHMPEMDGYEAASLLRQKQPDIPVIAMTASAMQEVKNGVMEAGFSGYLAKPIDPEQFYSAIGKAMGVPGSAFKKTKIAVTSTTTLPSIDGIDEKIGLRQTLGNKDRYREYLLDFAESHGKDEASIQAALDSNDLQDAISRVHALRGAAGTIGAMTLNMFAGDLEEALRSGRVPDMDTLKVFYSRINFIIDGIVSTISPSAGRRVLKPLLDELERLIRRSDKSALAVVDKIAGMTTGMTELSHLEKTRHALAHWDFDAALDALDDWRLESGNQV